jgi:TctA family transporter
MTLAALTTFFGWATLINIAMLVLAFILLALGRSMIIPLHARLLQVPETELPRIYLTFLGQYKLLIVVFNLVPYIALSLMSH